MFVVAMGSGGCVRDTLVGLPHDVPVWQNDHAQDVYNFTHVFKIGEVLTSTTFCTIVAPTLIGWDITYYYDDVWNDDSTAIIILRCTEPIGHIIDHSKFGGKFELRLKETNGQVTHLESETQVFADDRRWGRCVVCIPLSNGAGADKFKQHFESKNKENVCELVTTLTLTAAAFAPNIENCFNLAENPIPQFTDYLDVSHHDFTLRCTDGSVRTSSRALIVFSTFFGEHLITVSSLYEREYSMDLPCATVNTFLRFLFTGQLQINYADMTLENVKALSDLVTTHVLTTQQTIFWRKLSACCMKKVLMIADDLDALLPWLVWVLSDVRNSRGNQEDSREIFARTCVTFLIEHHWNDYLMNYIHNQKELSPEKQELKAKLLRSGDRDETPHDELVRYQRRRVRAVLKDEDTA